MENFQTENGNIQKETDQNVPRKNSLKQFIWFAIILCIAIGAVIAWKGYFSPNAQYIRESQKNYESYKKIEDAYLKALREDTYGGKTPQETLSLFVEALKKGDVDLASKYFSIEPGDSNKFKEALKKADQKTIDDLIENIKDAKQSTRNLGTETKIEFIKKNNDGEVEYSIILSLNKEINIWKIESL